MKNQFKRKCILLYIIALSVFVACKHEDLSHTNTLLLEQSTELTLANQRELSGLISSIAKINLNEKKLTSNEYERISNLYEEFEKFNLSIQHANRTQTVKMINCQNAKFKNDSIFKIPGFKFIPVKVEELNHLDDEVFKAYIASKISKFYLESAGYIFTTRKYGRERI